MLVERAKGAAIGLWVPVHFAYWTGHFRSALKRRAVDRHGHVVPWYSFPAVEYLSRIDFSDANILEFGGGQSTLWWSGRAKSVTTVEENPVWRRQLETSAPANVTVLPGPEQAAGTFDVVVVDGGERISNARRALELLNPAGGLIVFDNSDGDWFVEPSRWFKDAGLSRVDFYGYAAGVRRPQVTSVAFTDGIRFLRDAERPPAPSDP